MMKHKEGLLRERDRLQAEVDELQKRLQLQRLYTEELEKKREESKTRIKELVKQLDEHTNEQFKEKRILESTQNELKEVTAERDAANQELEHLRATASQNHRTILQQQLQLAAHRANIEKLTTSCNINSIKLAKINSDLDGMAQIKEKLTNELNTKNNLLKLKEDENNKFRLENSKAVKQKEAIMKKLVSTLGNKSNLEQDTLKLKNMIVTLEKERETSKKSLDQSKKYAESLIRERDLVRKDLVKANKSIAELKDQIILNEQQIKTLENDLKVSTTNEKKLSTGLAKTEKEREKALEDISTMNDKLESAQDEINHKQNTITEQKDKINDQQAKITHIQQMYETSRHERNAFQRELQSCTEERNELKERTKTLSRETEQLREDISNRDMEIGRLNRQVEKIEKEKQALKAEIQTTIIALQHSKTELQELKVTNSRLQKTITDDEETISKLKKRIDNTIHEKDVIGTQLIRRNDEINLLKEKMGIIQLALDRGESQYAKRLDDIRLLKIEISNLRSQRNLLTRGLANTADMRQEVLQLNRTLTQERVKAKALELEMLTPMNVHRWRKLHGKDPEKTELLEKVQTLQKRILSQTVTSVARENNFKEYKKMYATLKDFVLKIPSHDVKERLNSTQRALTASNKKMKALSAELNVKDDDIKAKECEVAEMKKELQKVRLELINMVRSFVRKLNLILMFYFLSLAFQRKKEQARMMEFKDTIDEQPKSV